LTIDAPVRSRAGAVHGGWYLLALEEELAGEVTPLALGDRALMVIRDGDRVRIFDARCPHRGAHLGYGGVLDAGHGARGAGAVICPFHGKRIGLGTGTARLCVAEHTVISAGAALFVRLGTEPADDRGFELAIKEICAEKQVVGAFVQPVRVAPEYVIENAFDVSHFAVVHKVPKVRGMQLSTQGPGRGAQGPGRDAQGRGRGAQGPGWLGIEGEFWTKAPPWEEQTGRDFCSRFVARAVSPSLVLTELGPDGASHTVITGASPAREGCVARVAFGVRPAARQAVPQLVAGARRAFDQDMAVWNHLDPSAPVRLDAGDTPVLAFRQFCASFAPLGPLG